MDILYRISFIKENKRFIIRSSWAMDIPTVKQLLNFCLIESDD